MQCGALRLVRCYFGAPLANGYSCLSEPARRSLPGGSKGNSGDTTLYRTSCCRSVTCPTKPPSRIDGSRGREISLTLLRDLLATGYSCVRKPVRRLLVLGVTTTLVNLTIHYSYRRLESTGQLVLSPLARRPGGFEARNLMYDRAPPPARRPGGVRT